MRLLNICTHKQLRQLRSAYLYAIGYEVVDGPDLGRSVEILRSGREFEMVILCHTLLHREKLWMESFIQGNCPKASTLELYLAESPVTSGMKLDAGTEFQTFMATASEQHLGRATSYFTEYQDDFGRGWQAFSQVN